MYEEWRTKAERPHWKAFRLRRATQTNPEEDSLTVGLTPQAAKAPLQPPFWGVVELSVGQIHGIHHNLQVRHTNEPERPSIFGLPRYSEYTDNQGTIYNHAVYDLMKILE